MDDIRFDGKLEYKVDNIGFVSVERNENFTFEYKNGKERYSFIYVENGELEYCFTSNGKTMKIDKGTLLYMPGHIPYKTRYLKDCTVIKIIIFDIDGEIADSYLTKPSAKRLADISAVFASISSMNMRSTLFLASKIYELLHMLKNDNLKIPKKYIKIIPAINEIKQKYFENKKISYYADICNMSESNFRKLFKEYTGKSPIEYRNLIRISEAKKMIDSGEFSVSDAAYMAGFNNMSFFYELYRTVFKTIKG